MTNPLVKGHSNWSTFCPKGPYQLESVLSLIETDLYNIMLRQQRTKKTDKKLVQGNEVFKTQ